ncbi:MAG: methyltransferase [Pseudonocardiaceae bacterium]
MSAELTPALSDLVDPVPGYALRTAATLRLADLVAAGLDTATTLAASAHADADAIGRLMRYLCSRGIFVLLPSGRYALTDFSVLLLDGDPSGLRKTLDSDSYGGRFDRAVSEMVDVVRSGEPAYPKLYGKTVYSDLEVLPGLGEMFTDVRAQHSARFAAELTSKINLAGCRRIADLGGGTGSVLLAVLEHNPTMTGALIDLPYIEARARGALQESAAGNRCDFIAASFFDPLPAADVYLLCNVLYNWNDADASRILARCAETKPGARVIVIERLITQDGDLELAAAQDLRLLAICGGKQRSAPEFIELAGAQGLILSSIVDTESGLSLLHFAT